MKLRAPFIWHGGKSSVALEVWRRLGAVHRYVEPFCGSLAVLLGNPKPAKVEIVNDADMFLVNFWRAVVRHPQEIAEICRYPIVEEEYHSRHYWLVTKGKRRIAELSGDVDRCDVEVAAWWVWAINLSMGRSYCSGDGPWHWGGEAWKQTVDPKATRCVGVDRMLIKIGNTALTGVFSPNRIDTLPEEFSALAARLQRVRVLNGDYSRCLSPSMLGMHEGKVVGVFFDSPYSAESVVETRLYSVPYDKTITAKVVEWSLKNGQNPLLRIAVCGYYDEFQAMPGWTCYRWHAHGGMSNHSATNENKTKEAVWFSPHCLKPSRGELFDGAKEGVQ